MLKFGVERCRLVPIHEKDLSIPDDSAALPDGECATAIVALACAAPMPIPSTAIWRSSRHTD
jgi:hypothetical protein